MLMINKINCLEDAKEIAKTLTEDQAQELLDHRNLLLYDAKIKIKLEKWDDAIILATKAQMCKHAIQDSQHSHILS